MNWQRIISTVGMITTITTCGTSHAETIVSGDLHIKNGGSIVFSDNSVQSTAPAGAAAYNLNIGTVTTGTPAAATLTGPAGNQLLNLTLPQGPPGPAGPSPQITLAAVCDAIRAGGTQLPPFCLATAVSAITAPSVMYGKQSSFTVNGTDLDGATVTASGGCSVLAESAGGTSTARTFTCTPAVVGPLTISVAAGAKVLNQTMFTVSNPQVTLTTSLGTIVVELFPAQAPLTVNNFLLYVNEGFYSNTIFHRVVSGFVVQGGGFGTDGVQKTPTHPAIPLEPPSATGLINAQGTIAMARQTALNTATCQFYFNTVNNNGTYSTVYPGLYSGNNLDVPPGQGYAVFGSVIQGLNIVQAIEAVPVVDTTNYKPVANVVITSATQSR